MRPSLRRTKNVVLPAILAVAFHLMTGCASEPPVALLDVEAFAPSEVDVGDRLEVLGSGFPEGKLATLTFHGDLHRPGREPVRDVEIVARAATTSPTRIAVVLTDALQTEFCGRGDAAEHTTFHGDVIAAFSPKKTRAAPITGTVHGVVLDVESPNVSKPTAEYRMRDGERALQFFGIKLSEVPGHAVVVAAVQPDSRAERAGLQAGDTLIEFDGVSVRSAIDLVPSGERHFADLTMRRGRIDGPLARRIDVSGFKPVAPSELQLAALLIGVAAAIVLLFAAPSSRLLTWAARRTATRLRATAPNGSLKVRLLAALRALKSAMPFDALPPASITRVVPHSLLLGVSCVLTLIAYGRALVLPEIDLLILLVGSSTIAVTIGLVCGGFEQVRNGPSRWSLRAALQRAFVLVCLELPSYAATACVVMTTGSLRAEDVVLAQGGSPWRFGALSSPTLLLSLVLVLVAAIPELIETASELPEADSIVVGAEHGRRRVTLSLLVIADFMRVLVTSGLVATMLLGGYRLPLVTASAQAANAPLQALGAVVLLAKWWTLVLLIYGARWALGRVSARQALAACWRWLLPFAIVSVLLTAAWIHGLQSPTLRSIENGMSPLLLLLSLFLAGYFAVRVVANIRSAAQHLNVNPWI